MNEYVQPADPRCPLGGRDRCWLDRHGPEVACMGLAEALEFVRSRTEQRSVG